MGMLDKCSAWSIHPSYTIQMVEYSQICNLNQPFLLFVVYTYNQIRQNTVHFQCIHSIGREIHDSFNSMVGRIFNTKLHTSSKQVPFHQPYQNAQQCQTSVYNYANKYIFSTENDMLRLKRVTLPLLYKFYKQAKCVIYCYLLLPSY